MKIYDNKHLNLLREITLSRFKLKDQSTFFGFMWSFLNPLLMLVVLFIFFSLAMGGKVEHYVVYLLIGIIQYTHFSNSTFDSMRILSNMKQLTRETVFPKELLVFGSILANAREFVLSLLIGLLVAYVSGVNFSWTVFMLPFVLVLQLMLVVWVSLLLSCVYLYIKDIDHIYQVFLRVLFFTTPIFYDLSYLGDGIAKDIALINPLTHLITFSRTIIIEGRPFSLNSMFILFLINAFLIYFAYKIFKKLEPKFAERV